MKGIRAGFNSNIDDGARLPTIFRARILLRFKFIDSIDREHRSGITGGHDRIHHALRHPRIVAIDTVYHEEVVMGAQTVGTLGPARVANIFGYAGAQVEQILKVSAVQGQVVDDCVLQCSAKLGVRGFDERNLLGYRNGLCLLAGLQREVNPKFLADFQDNVLALGGLEAFEFRANLVSARSQVRSIIRSRFVRGERTRGSSLDVQDGYSGAGDGTAIGVRNGSDDAAGTALRKRRNAKHEYSKRCT